VSRNSEQREHEVRHLEMMTTAHSLPQKEKQKLAAKLSAQVKALVILFLGKWKEKFCVEKAIVGQATIVENDEEGSHGATCQILVLSAWLGKSTVLAAGSVVRGKNDHGK
jgi:hypothetical protein